MIHVEYQTELNEIEFHICRRMAISPTAPSKRLSSEQQKSVDVFVHAVLRWLWVVRLSQSLVSTGDNEGEVK